MGRFLKCAMVVAGLVAPGFVLTGPVRSVEVKMEELVLQLNGEPLAFHPAPVLDDKRILVPLHRFTEAVGAEAKVLENDGPLVVCREDLCIPLNGGEDSTLEIGGVLYGNLAAFGGPLGLHWEVSMDTLKVHTSGSQEKAGLGIGDLPPVFELPDLYTGEPVSPIAYRGKKTVFYMWASW